MRNPVVLGLTCVLILAPAAEARGQEGRGLALLEATAERYEAVRSFCAGFHQTLEVTLLGQERSGVGRLCQAGPDRFAMRFREPEGDAVVVDGDWVWVYYPSTDPGQVLKLPMAQAPGGFDFHRAFLTDPAEKYEVRYGERDVVAGHPVHRLELTPRDPAARYRSAEVWIDDGTPLLRRIRITEENGSVRTVLLSDVELGAEAPGGWFEFTPPTGVQVIQR
jgi:outer membrane lipoprotein carrier protein